MEASANNRTTNPLRVLLVDPSLFTAPYDAALADGLRANQVHPTLATRSLRHGETTDLRVEEVWEAFYPWTDGKRRREGRWWKLLKGVEHIRGMRLLGHAVSQSAFDIVHFQWSLVPAVDARVIKRMRRSAPVVLTVHDTTPFNGRNVSRMQRDGFDKVLHLADHLIVHTEGGRETLKASGLSESRISVIPHGPLALKPLAASPESRAGGRWRVVLFGRLQTYKGVDTLVEAIGLLSPEDRNRLEIIVAGEPHMPMEPLQTRAAALGLDDDTISFRCWRHDDEEMSALLTSADCFVFPYRAIEASGVLFMVAGLGKWIIASDLGAFRDIVGGDGQQGALIAPDDPEVLAKALSTSIGKAPSGASLSRTPDWEEIGAMTRALYDEALSRFHKGKS